MKVIGFEEISSSELGIRGGTASDVVRTVFEIAVAVFAFVKNYWSSITKGYNDGYNFGY